MSLNAILYPAFALALLTFVVLNRLGARRFASLKKNPVDPRVFKTMTNTGEPENVVVASRNFSNLFESPVLFYVGLLITRTANLISPTLIVLAWIYVALRFAHTIIHLTSNIVIWRMRIFVASIGILLAFWIVLFAQLWQQ